MSSRFGTKWGRIATATLLAAVLLAPQVYAATPGISGGTANNGIVGTCPVCIEVPYIPTWDHIALGALHPISTIEPVPSLTTTFCIPGVGALGFSICFPVPDLVNVLPWLYDSIANAVITGFNAIYKAGASALVTVANAAIDVLNAPIDLFDGFTTSTGALLLGGVVSLPEPWSAFLTPFVWLFVVAILFVLVVAMIWGVKQVVSSLKQGAEVVEFAG